MFAERERDSDDATSVMRVHDGLRMGVGTTRHRIRHICACLLPAEKPILDVPEFSSPSLVWQQRYRSTLCERLVDEELHNVEMLFSR